MDRVHARQSVGHTRLGHAHDSKGEGISLRQLLLLCSNLLLFHIREETNTDASQFIQELKSNELIQS